MNKPTQLNNEKNNFDTVRIGLALIVVFSHLSALSQIPDFKVFDGIFDANFAVKGFFAISGFLVTRSYLSSKSILDYAEKRFRRIYPAYISAIFLCLIIGLYSTKLGALNFVVSTQTIKYFFSNALFLNFLQPTLPLVFEANPMQALNGSLWTIKVEIMLYFCVPALIYLYKNFGSLKTTFVLFCLSVAWVYFFRFICKLGAADEISRQFPGQLSYFALGALFAVNDDALAQIKWISAVSLATLLALDSPYLRLAIEPICYSSIVLFLSTSAFKTLHLGKYGDISYGIYLYHFPIIQLLISLGLFEQYVWLGFCLTFILTILAAFASWHLVEKRFLRRTSHYISQA